MPLFTYPTTLNVVVSSLTFILLYLLKTTLRKHRAVYPPGPTPNVITGNLRDVPTSQPWITYLEWGKRYGSGILHFSVFGQHVIILNSHKVANDLLDKRSTIYSDRPYIPMIKMTGWDFNSGLLPYGDLWRRHRKVFQQIFNKNVNIAYQPTQTFKVHQLLRNLLYAPKDFAMHYKTLPAAVVMATMYGHNIASQNDHFVTMADRAGALGAESLLPGAAAVNTFPVLRYLPTWFPGFSFWRIAMECKKLTSEMKRAPFEFVKRNMASETGQPCVVAQLLEANNAWGGSLEDENIIQEVAATTYAGGSDTTASALGSFFYAMTINPQVQLKAREELDRVIGSDRLPEFSDRPSLPYVEAIYREVLRWRPVTPLGIPHATSQDDVYDGYLIPKGSIVLSNVWAMTRDELKYIKPDEFWPERFLDADGILDDDDTVLTFGFGRRICVGRHLASSSVWFTIASVLATFDISKGKDDEGKEIDTEVKYTDGAISHVEFFPCSISVRSVAAQRLVEDTKSVTNRND